MRVLDSKTFGGTYQFHQELGKGATASVFKIKNISSSGQENGTYACKQISTNYLFDPDVKRAEFRWKSLIREVTIMEMLDSPHVIRMHEFIRTKNNFYMV